MKHLALSMCVCFTIGGCIVANAAALLTGALWGIVVAILLAGERR